jgi:hypothetical protein
MVVAKENRGEEAERHEVRAAEQLEISRDPAIVRTHGGNSQASAGPAGKRRDAALSLP